MTPGERAQAIADQNAKLPVVDANGRPVDPAKRTVWTIDPDTGLPVPHGAA